MYRGFNSFFLLFKTFTLYFLCGKLWYAEVNKTETKLSEFSGLYNNQGTGTLWKYLKNPSK